ncbi:hypothetical protein, partial [Streptomyces sp. NPDC005125]
MTALTVPDALVFSLRYRWSGWRAYENESPAGRSAGRQQCGAAAMGRPGIMNYTEKPEYGRVVDICTK